MLTSLAQSSAKFEEGILIQGAFSLGGSSGGWGMPDSVTLVEKSCFFDRLKIKTKNWR